MPQQFKLPTKRQEEGTPGYALTHFYALSTYDQRSRFDEWRKARGKAPNFQDEKLGENLPSNGFFVDVADTDRLDQAFLSGMGAAFVEGVRIPWPYQGFFSIELDPRFQLLRPYIKCYTIWPTSHALFQISHSFLTFLSDVVAKAKVVVPLNDDAPLVLPDEAEDEEEESFADNDDE